MGEDDGRGGQIDSSRILQEHSYHKMRKTVPTSSKTIELHFSDKCPWSTSDHTDLNKDKLMNGHRASEMVQDQQPSFSNDKIVKKKARVEDIIMNLKKTKAMVTKEPKSDSDSSSFISMCTIREEPDDFESIDLPPLKPATALQQPEAEHDNKTVLLVSTGETLQTSANSSVYLGRSLPTAPDTNTPVKQVIYHAIPQTNVLNQDRLQRPLILNKLPSGNITNSSLLGTNASVQADALRSPNNPPQTQPQRQLLLISRPGAPPLYLAHGLKVHDNQTGRSGSNVRPLNTNNRNVITSPPSGNEAQVAKTQPPLIIQYRVPYLNSACKIVTSPSGRNAYLGSPTQTSGTLPNLVCTETMSSFENGSALPTQVPRMQKQVEIPVSFAGNHTAHVTTISDDEEELMRRPTTFIPSLISGTKPKILSTKGSINKHNQRSTVTECRGKAKSAKSGKDAIQNGKQNRTASLKNTRNLQRGKETFPEKKSTGASTVRANCSMNASRTLSNGHTKPGKQKTVLTTVRVSSRKKQRTEKAKLLDKTKKQKGNKKDILQLRYAKKSKNNKLKTTITIKTEPVDEDDIKVIPPVKPQHLENSAVKLENPKDREQHGGALGDKTPSVDVVSSAQDSNESGNLFRDPALLTREERALQRALLLFKEMEDKQSRKKLPTVANVPMCKSKRNLRKRMNLRQLNRNSEVSRKRKVINEGNDNSFTKRRKIEAEKQLSRKKILLIASKPVENVKGSTDIHQKVKKRKISSDKEEVKKPKEIRPAVRKQPLSNIKERNVPPNTTEKCTNPKQVQDVTNIRKELKSPKQLEKNAVSAHEKAHRVKTYMLIPSYHGFQDFSPVVLGSRTRSKKAEPDKSFEDNVTPPKKVETPKKDIPLLVIETVNNKPVKQDVVVKDEQMRDLVTNSLRAQGMLKQELELAKKTTDEEHFENREKRNISVNRNTGETVLHKAARMGYDETVYHSIHQGCDSNAKDYAGWTPLHEACSRGHTDVVRVLVKYNANVNSCSNDGIRPIHDAADNGNTDILRLLIAYGADPLLATYSGRACIDCAKSTKAKDYIKACIGDLYLADQRNNDVEVDYEDRWEFRGSCDLLDEDAKYTSGIFDGLPTQKASSSVEFEWSDTPHLPTYNLPLIKDGLITGRKNYVRLHDLQERLGKSRSTLIRLLKRTEIRNVPWSEFSKEVSKSCFNKLSDSPASSSTEEGNIEMVPLNWNVRCLLKIKSENIAV